MYRLKNNMVIRQTNGDISVQYEGEWYEYDGNRYYTFVAGGIRTSPDGQLVKKRISKKSFLEVLEKAEEIVREAEKNLKECLSKPA